MKKSVLLIDNNDSFTYNLVQLIKECGGEAHVVNIADVSEFPCDNYNKIMLSPGPELPSKYPGMMKVIDLYHQTKDILGICLGHQAIGEFFGFKLKHLGFPRHGIKSTVNITGAEKIFEGLPGSIEVGRYHSWVLESNLCITDIKVTSFCNEGNIMSIAHKHFSVRGVQFHPESIMTEHGKIIIGNWLRM